MDDKDPHSAFSLRPDVEMVDGKDSSEGLPNKDSEHDNKDQDRDLGSDVRVKANKRQTTAFGTLVKMLSGLLSSVVVLLHQPFSKDGNGSWTGEEVRRKGVGGSSQSSDRLDLWKRKKSNRFRLLQKDSMMHIMFCHQRNLKYGRDHSEMKNIRKQTKGLYEKSAGEELRMLFDLFGDFQPACLSVSVYPVSRQQGVNSGAIPQRTLSVQRPSLANSQWPPDTLHGTPWFTFRQELYRMGTFLNLPLNFPISPLRLAEAGFLLLDNNVIACYFCGLRPVEWSRGVSPIEVHRQLSPDCPFVTGQNCDNVAVDDMQPTDQLERVMQSWSLTGPELPHNKGNEESHRASRHTGGHLPPQEMPPASLVNGVHHLDISEDGSASDAQGKASAVSEGATGYSPPPPSNQDVSGEGSPAPRQPPIRLGLMGGGASSANPGQGTGDRASILDGTAQPEPPSPPQPQPPSPPQLQPPQRSGGRQMVTYQQLGIITGKPKRPEKATVHARLATFRSWPDNQRPTALQLSEAGFYYAGYADCGRCFFCAGGLKSWEAADNAWVEHARWFPTCPYVRQCMGQDFVDILQELNAGDNTRQITMTQVREEIERRQAGGDHIQELIADPAVSSAVHVGFSQQSIEAAAQELHSEGHQLSVVKLIDQLHAMGSEPAPGQSSMAHFNPVNAQGEVDRLQTENTELRQRSVCKVCLENEVTIVLLPCGHLVTCATCSPAVHSCPVCRMSIQGRVRAFPTSGN